LRLSLIRIERGLILSSIYDDDYFITEIGMPHIFPNPREASDEGLMAYGGDLDPNRLLKAYRNGIFHGFNEGDPNLLVVHQIPRAFCFYPRMEV